MAGKAVISLSTGLEDAEKVTVAFLVAVGAAESGRPTLMFQTKEAVRLALDGVAAGQNLAPKFKGKSPGVWELMLSRPLTELPRGKLTVSVKDRQGNLTRIERTFGVVTRP